MWSRVIEFMLACWLAISPYVFGYGGDATFLWVNDYLCAALIATFALLSFNRRLGRMHLLTLLVAAWLIGVGFVGDEPPPPPPYQNYVVIGLLLGMFAILPSRSSYPPRAWRRFYEKLAEQSNA